MATRHLLKFSVRANMTKRPERIAKLLTEALGCTFREDYYQKEIPAWKAELLGMEIHLYEWRGIKNSRIYRLHGQPDNWVYEQLSKTKDVKFTLTDISDSVADLLEAKDAGAWYTPSEKDIEAEIAYGKRINGSR